MTTQGQLELRSMLTIYDAEVWSLDLIALLMETVPPVSDIKLHSCRSSAYIPPVIVSWKCSLLSLYLCVCLAFPARNHSAKLSCLHRPLPPKLLVAKICLSSTLGEIVKIPFSRSAFINNHLQHFPQARFPGSVLALHSGAVHSLFQALCVCFSALQILFRT